MPRLDETPRRRNATPEPCAGGYGGAGPRMSHVTVVGEDWRSAEGLVTVAGVAEVQGSAPRENHYIHSFFYSMGSSSRAKTSSKTHSLIIMLRNSDTSSKNV